MITKKLLTARKPRPYRIFRAYAIAMTQFLWLLRFSKPFCLITVAKKTKTAVYNEQKLQIIPVYYVTFEMAKRWMTHGTISL